jgi:hypothetical protein
MAPEDPHFAAGTRPDGSDDGRDDGSDGEVVDELPEDLQPELAGPITFPDNNRRRIPAVLYLLLAAVCIGLAAGKGSSPFVNTGLGVAGGLLAAFGLYGLYAGRSLRVDEGQALAAANRALGFPIGHASAQMSWRGLASRPVWRLLVYSAEEPPLRRAMAIVDGVSGEVLEHFSEANPEDWGA